jgi:transcriptional regulator with XRE-family HTH domain
MSYSMTPEDFKLWMASQNLAKAGAARALGVSEATVADWMRGKSRSSGKPVAPDRRTALACSALAAGLDEWKPGVNENVNVNAAIHKM